MQVKHVAIVARISVDNEGRGEGVEDQVVWGREYAADTWPDAAIEIYCDNHVSATDASTERPEFARLTADIAAGRIAAIVATERSRLMRDAAEWFRYVDDVLLPAGIDVLHTKRRGVLDIDDLAADVDAVLGRREVRVLRQRVLDKHETLARAGRPSGGAQFGYRHGTDEEGRSALVIQPDEAELIREAYAWIFVGRSLTAVAEEWTARGVPRPRGGVGPWSPSTIRRLLVKPSITGLRVHRRNGSENLYPATWEPIVSRDEWERMRVWLSSRTTTINTSGAEQPITHSKRPPRRYLLTGGIARCGLCGVRLGCQQKQLSGRRPVPYYSCERRHGGCGKIGIRADHFEAQVEREFLAAIDTPEFRAMVADGDPNLERRDEITADLAAIETKRHRFGNMLADDELDAVAYQAARSRLDEQESGLKAELGSMPAWAPPVDLDDLAADWAFATLEEKRHLLSLFVECVVVGPGRPRVYDPTRVQIRWRS